MLLQWTDGWMDGQTKPITARQQRNRQPKNKVTMLLLLLGGEEEEPFLYVGRPSYKN